MDRISPAGRKKGTPKTGGRQKGTPNKVNGKGREYLADILERYFGEGIQVPGVDGPTFVSFETDITDSSVTHKDRMVIMKDIAQYAYPKIQATQLEATVEAIDPLKSRLLEMSTLEDGGQEPQE